MTHSISYLNKNVWYYYYILFRFEFIFHVNMEILYIHVVLIKKNRISCYQLLLINTFNYPSLLGIAALSTNVFCAHSWLDIYCFYIVGSYSSTMNVVVSPIRIPKLFLTHDSMNFLEQGIHRIVKIRWRRVDISRYRKNHRV